MEAAMAVPRHCHGSAMAVPWYLGRSLAESWQSDGPAMAVEWTEGRGWVSTRRSVWQH